jgi:hypothetical protein
MVEQKDVKIDFKDECRRTPLSWAAQYEYGIVVQLLLKCDNVEADSKDAHGWTSLS